MTACAVTENTSLATLCNIGLKPAHISLVLFLSRVLFLRVDYFNGCLLSQFYSKYNIVIVSYFHLPIGGAGLSGRVLNIEGWKSITIVCPRVYVFDLEAVAFV